MAFGVLSLHVRCAASTSRSLCVLTFAQDPWYPEVNVTSSCFDPHAHTAQSTGSAGLIQTIRAFSKPSLPAAIVGTIATVGWVLQGVGLGFYYRQVSSRRLLLRTLSLRSP